MSVTPAKNAINTGALQGKLSRTFFFKTRTLGLFFGTSETGDGSYGSLMGTPTTPRSWDAP